jgi:hypothetical protein
MMTRPPGPGEPPWRDEAAGRPASVAALWALALGRFRDYLHWATSARMNEAAGDHPAREATGDHQHRETVRDPRQDRGETHDPDR